MSLVVLGGPSGSGKSTVGRAAAALAGAAFVEADDYHDEVARARMARGSGLTDAERMPWLDRVADAANACATPHVVVACSALNDAVRARLRERLTRMPTFVMLDVPRSELATRLEERLGHFAGPALLESQLASVQPTGAVRLDGTKPADVLAAEVTALLRAASTPGSPRTA